MEINVYSGKPVQVMPRMLLPAFLLLLKLRFQPAVLSLFLLPPLKVPASPRAVTIIWIFIIYIFYTPLSNISLTRFVFSLEESFIYFIA